MRAILTFLVAGVAFAAAAQERPAEIDPNTKIQGGADVRGSGSSAGAGAQIESRTDTEKPPLAPPQEMNRSEKDASEKDKPISARKPQEREREDASQGSTIKTPLQ